MGKRTLTFATGTILLISIMFLMGCNEVNRKHFTTLEPTKAEDGTQHFTYKASTGAARLTCAPGSKKCRVDKSANTALWPLEDKEAEKLRMEWLEKNLAEKGYQNQKYEIVSRELILANSLYDVSYDVKVAMR